MNKLWKTVETSSKCGFRTRANNFQTQIINFRRIRFYDLFSCPGLIHIGSE